MKSCIKDPKVRKRFLVNEVMLVKPRKEDISSLLQSHVDQEWVPKPPATEEQIAEAENQLGFSFCEDYRQLLLHSNGGYFHINECVSFFSIRHLYEFNIGESRFPGLSGMLVFGNDNGDYVFYMDPKGYFGKGKWAVFMVEKGCQNRELSMFLASDFRFFIKRITDGDSFGEEQYLGG